MFSFKDKDIIILSLQSWDLEIGSNIKNIALELSQQNRVLFVNRALDRLSIFRVFKDKKIKSRLLTFLRIKPNLSQIQSNLWVLNPRIILESINWIKRPSLFNKINSINNKRLAEAINDAIVKLELENVIVIVDNDFLRAVYLKELIHNKLFIYYIRDYLINQSYFKQHGARLEKEIVSKADVVVANSAYLQKYTYQYNPNSFDVGQGCDFTNFQKPESLVKPSNLKGIDSPIIGYIGYLTSLRLDIQLIHDLANSQPDWNIVLVGPEDEAFRKSDLHHLKNVHFLGRVAPDFLAHYIKHFDVCINPQALNEMTIGNYPRKIDEYLAMGKPTVATKTESMEMFKDHVYLSVNSNDFITKVKIALDNPPFDIAKRTFALTHSWKNSVLLIEKGVRTCFKTKVADGKP